MAMLAPGTDPDEPAVVQVTNLILSGAIKVAATDVYIELGSEVQGELSGVPGVHAFYRKDGVVHDMRLLGVMNPPERVHVGVLARLKMMAGIPAEGTGFVQEGKIQFELTHPRRALDLHVSILPEDRLNKVEISIKEVGPLEAPF